MADVSGAKALIAAEKYREAGKALARLLQERETDELWYLRGLVSLKLRNYDDALEAFEHALSIKRTPLYYRMEGIARLERFELERALKDFSEALRLDGADLLSNFYVAVCYMFMDDPKSAVYLKRAFALDKERTKSMLRNFYVMFFRKDPLVSKALKEDLARRIDRIKTN
jgi:tetratricopeptide (TPR) repeat protein